MDKLDPIAIGAYNQRAAPIVPRLLAAMPSIVDQWAEYLAYWDGKNEGAYLDMAEFARHLVDRMATGDTSEFEATFDVVEDLLRTGDEVVVEVLTVGLLEDIQNGGANRYGWPFVASFRPWLGPLTTDRWDLLHRDWGTSDGG